MRENLLEKSGKDKDKGNEAVDPELQESVVALFEMEQGETCKKNVGRPGA